MNDELKDKVIKTAVRLFGQYGSDNVQLREIAFDSGVNIEEIKAQFKNNDEILRCIPSYIDARSIHYQLTQEEIEEQLTVVPPEKILMNFLFYYHQEDPLGKDLYRFLYMQHCSNPDYRAITREHLLTRPAKCYRAALDILIDLKAIPPCDSYALSEILARTMFIYGVKSMHSDHFDEGDEYFAVSRFIVQMAARGLTALPLDYKRKERQEQSRWMRFNEEKLDPREKIMFRALELFSKNGFSNVSMRKIAASCLPNVTAIFSFYSNKGDILRDMNQRLLNGYNQFTLANPTLHTLFDNQDAKGIVSALAHPYLPMKEIFVVKLYRVLFREMPLNEEIVDLFTSIIYRDVNLFTQFIENLILEGIIPSCEARYISIAYIHTMLSFHLEVPPDDGKPEQNADEKLEQDEQRIRVAAQLTSFLLYGFLQPAA